MPQTAERMAHSDEKYSETMAPTLSKQDVSGNGERLLRALPLYILAVVTAFGVGAVSNPSGLMLILLSQVGLGIWLVLAWLPGRE